MEEGRMAVAADPTGGIICFWQAKNHRGFGRVHEHGAVCWAELVTDDLARAGTFFTDILGVSTALMPMGDGVL